jgi:hypothetical protein
MVHIFAPEQHDLYDGHFVISANRIYMAGALNDPEGWDHLDNDNRGAASEQVVAVSEKPAGTSRSGSRRQSPALAGRSRWRSL